MQFQFFNGTSSKIFLKVSVIVKTFWKKKCNKHVIKTQILEPWDFFHIKKNFIIRIFIQTFSKKIEVFQRILDKTIQNGNYMEIDFTCSFIYVICVKKEWKISTVHGLLKIKWNYYKKLILIV